jgi:hypothetical protein
MTEQCVYVGGGRQTTGTLNYAFDRTSMRLNREKNTTKRSLYVSSEQRSFCKKTSSIVHNVCTLHCDEGRDNRDLFSSWFGP